MIRKNDYRTRFLLTAAAATATIASSSSFHHGAAAFSVNPTRQLASAALSRHNDYLLVRERPSSTRQARTFLSSSQRGGGNDGGGGFLEKVGSAVKSILPASWFQSEQEKRAALERRRVKDEISGGLTDLLKDAPLPIRMVGSLVKPLISSAMSSLAETMAEQQESVSSLMSTAQLCLDSDERVAQLLGSGGGLQVSNPFSQSSSTSSINGQTTSRVDLAFEVYGAVQSGVVRLSASNGKITQLTLQAANGRVVEVRTSPSSFSRSRSRVLGNDDDDSSSNIIEAEIIEKKPRP
jgi:Cytochrome oxidase complex assembly protein 1